RASHEYLNKFLMRSGGAFARLYLFEEPDNDHAEKTKQRKPTEDVHEGPAQSLAHQLAVEIGLRGMQRVGLAKRVGESVPHIRDSGFEGLSGLRYLVENLVLMDGGAAREQGGGYRNAYGTTDVAHQVEDAAGVADLFVFQSAV